MAEITESFEKFLSRITRKLIIQLVELEGSGSDVLAEIRIARLVRTAIDAHIYALVKLGTFDDAERLLDEILDFQAQVPRPTWKEIGDALGVSAQAAHRRYRYDRPGSTP